ncbi:MAG TPA: 2,3-diaminopropionate biosynthesis protein SbnA [Blastocatellia bacterium]|nr:2,3-diaminopropionate biosynthesis protein SbnA [Blastocatellia bacterium]
MSKGILSAIGNTPLVQLARVFPKARFKIYAKLEALNPGGSMKDRPALRILTEGLASGEISQDTVVIESSSGNMGVGLAQACSYLGLKFVCVVDPKATGQNIRLIEAYGAEVDRVTEPDPVTGEFLQARLSRVRELMAATKHGFWPDQYSNLNNAQAHRETMREVVGALDGKLDILFCATSTCGTLRGCREYVRDSGLPIRIVAVDAVGSVIFGGSASKRLVPGHGAAVRPALYDAELADQVVHVTDLECITGCRLLVRREAILAGGSSGGVIMALNRLASDMQDGAVCAAILPDRGERYLDTIYSDEWVGRHFGEVSYLWQEERKTRHA